MASLASSAVLQKFEGASAFGFWLAGWFGIGTVGVFGLLISATTAFSSGRAVVDNFGDSDAPMFTRQLEEERKSQSSPEQKMAAEAARRARSRTLYLINSIFIAMTALGFWMFMQHDL